MPTSGDNAVARELPRGMLYIISAPSGAGKTSLVHALVDSMDGIVASVSHTTRARRMGEQDGVHYHFVKPERFEEMIGEGIFLEHARVFNHHYGTSRDWVEARRASGLDVSLAIDWQGARQVRAQVADSISIFILPPSRAELRRRLEKRDTDDPATVLRRMNEAVAELSHYTEYDYLVLNDDFPRALEDLQSIVRSARLSQARQRVKLMQLLKETLAPGPES